MSDSADSRAKRNSSNDSAAIDDMVENEAPILTVAHKVLQSIKIAHSWICMRRRGSYQYAKKFASNERNVVPGC